MATAVGGHPPGIRGNQSTRRGPMVVRIRRVTERHSTDPRPGNVPTDGANRTPGNGTRTRGPPRPASGDRPGSDRDAGGRSVTVTDGRCAGPALTAMPPI